MSSIHASSETSTSTSTSGENSGKIGARMDKVSVIGETVSEKRVGEPILENSLAIQSLLLSQQKVKPNQSVRSLLNGAVGDAVAVLANFKPDPGSSDAINASSLLQSSSRERRKFLARQRMSSLCY